MSFFGFDAALPEGDAGRGGGKGIFEHTNPFTQVSNARKLQAFQDVENETYVRVVRNVRLELTLPSLQY